MSRDQQFAHNQRHLITSTRLRGAEPVGTSENSVESETSTIQGGGDEFQFAEQTYYETPSITLRGNDVHEVSFELQPDDSLASKLSSLKNEVEQYLQISENSENWRDSYGEHFKDISSRLNALNRESLVQDDIEIISH